MENKDRKSFQLCEDKEQAEQNQPEWNTTYQRKKGPH